MISNGLKITDRAVTKRLKDLGLKNITISLYSLVPEIHDKMTKVRGSHQKTMRAIDLALQEGLDVSVNALLTKDNIEGIFDLEDWALSKNLALKTDAMITPKLDGGMEPTELRASKEQLREYYRAKIQKWPAARPKPSGDTLNHYTCNAGKGKCAVTAYGELLPCIEIRDALGSLLQKPFHELWHGEGVRKWRDLKWQDIEGADQKTASFCDHCPGMAKNETGSAKKTTCFSKDLAEIKRELASPGTER
jgi:MoaA/NifB/PqqE/SkfB family radical SAM enzyme